MEGKLGKLAKEIAEETAKDLDIDMSDESSVDGVFKNLFKQPSRLMSLVKTVGSKLDEKMKSGDIKESELLEEASEIMQKMKNMPGMGNLKEMFGKMGIPVPGGKMDLSAMRNNLNRNMKTAKQKERMKAKLYKRQLQKQGHNLRGNFNTPATRPATRPATPPAPLHVPTAAPSTDNVANVSLSSDKANSGSIQSVGNVNGVENMVFSTGKPYNKSTKPQTTGNKKKRRKKKK